MHFPQHMEETDRRIQVMSEVTDRGSVFDQMTEALGLRGHLQDELLRIMAMLAAEDPDLNVSSTNTGNVAPLAIWPVLGLQGGQPNCLEEYHNKI